MARKRVAINKGLPPNWIFYHGAIYYRVPPSCEAAWDGKNQLRLGKTLSDAYLSYSARIKVEDMIIVTIGQLFERYALEVVPTKAPKTQIENQRAIKNLSATFWDIPIADFEPIHAYQYRDRRGKDAPTSANRELEVLSHAFTKAIEWGVARNHPMIEGKFRKISTPPRDRYIEDWEIAEILKLESKRVLGSIRAIQAYIKIKLLTGLRRGDMLSLRTSDLKEDGIHVQPRKTAKTTRIRLIINWSPTLRTTVEEALAARPGRHVPWLFCTTHGECYVREDGSANAWDCMWQRFMERVLKETRVEKRFTEHDLRAKCGSDADSLEHAQALLAHADSATTKRIFRGRPDRIDPLR